VEELGVVATFCHGHNRTFKGKGMYLHECQAQAIEGDTEFEEATQWSVQAIKSSARRAPAKREDMCCPLQRDRSPWTSRSKCVGRWAGFFEALVKNGSKRSPAVVYVGPLEMLQHFLWK
jgi:hypothetical protein